MSSSLKMPCSQKGLSTSLRTPLSLSTAKMWQFEIVVCPHNVAYNEYINKKKISIKKKPKREKKM
jgi:hypothetical protein